MPNYHQDSLSNTLTIEVKDKYENNNSRENNQIFGIFGYSGDGNNHSFWKQHHNVKEKYSQN